jgi:hypothetical protein
MSLRKYDIIWISAGISICGSLWYMGRPGVHGEDLAAGVAGVTERGMGEYDGTNAVPLASNTVLRAVAWQPVYETLLGGTRGMALHDPDPNTGICWITADDTRLPADNAQVRASTETVAPFVSLGSRIPAAGVRFANQGGAYTNVPLPLTNFPLTVWLWPYATTNAMPPFTIGASPWTSGNWWTDSGLGTNIYLWGCERATGELAVRTNHTYTITNITTFVTGYHIGDVYTYQGEVDAAPYSGTAKRYTSAGNVYPLWWVPSMGYWKTAASLGTSGYTSFGATWPDMNRFGLSDSAANTIYLRHDVQVITNVPLGLLKAVTTNNLTQARAALSRMTRTFKTIGTIGCKEVTVCSRYRAFSSEWPWVYDAWTNNVMGTPESSGTPYYELYQEYKDEWTESGTETNACATVGDGDRLAWKPWPDTVLFAEEGTEPPSCYTHAREYLYQYLQCSVTNYPCAYAYASGYVARVRIYMITGDAAEHHTNRWWKICDAVNPTAPPVFSIGGSNFTPSEEAWPQLKLLESDFEDLYGPDSGNYWENYSEFGIIEWDYDGGTGNPDIEVRTFAMIVDWKWRHFGETEYEPEPYVPPWAE